MNRTAASSTCGSRRMRLWPRPSVVRSSAPGQANWWTKEAVQARDTALREMASLFYPGHKAAGQAYVIHRRAVRYAGAGWRLDRARGEMPERYRATETEYLWRAFKSGSTMPLSKRQLQSILAVDRHSDAT